MSEVGNAFLETVFSKRLEAATRRKWVQKQGKPDSRWTKCPELDPVVTSTLSKETIKADNKAKQLHTFWLDAATPLVAAIQDIKDGKVETAEIVKALQTALLFLGNALQHHVEQRHQAILQQLNPQLKSLIKDENFADAPPYLFGEHFASLAKECLEVALVLKKSASTSSTAKQSFQRGHPQRYAWGCEDGSQYQNGQESSRGQRGQPTGVSNASSSGPPPAKKYLEQYPAPHYSHVLNQLICAQSTQVATPQHRVHTSLPAACTGGAQHQSHQQQQSAPCPGVTQHLQQLTANMNMNITCSWLAGRLPIFIEN